MEFHRSLQKGTNAEYDINRDFQFSKYYYVTTLSLLQAVLEYSRSLFGILEEVNRVQNVSEYLSQSKVLLS
jgi:hypothetical protein